MGVGHFVPTGTTGERHQVRIYLQVVLDITQL